MKRTVLFAGLLFLSGLFGLFSQQAPNVILWQDFENGLTQDRVASQPWTVEGDVTLVDNPAMFDSKCAHLLTSNTAVATYTSPWINRPSATHGVRLELRHIAMLPASAGAYIKVQYEENGLWFPLAYNSSTLQYDRRWGGGSTNFNSAFYKMCYKFNPPDGWGRSSANEEPDETYWQREVFVLNAQLSNSTRFRIRFEIPNPPRQGTDWHGWNIDDVKIYCGTTPGANIVIPSIKMVSYPDILPWATAQDVDIVAQIEDAGSNGISLGDSSYVEYYIGSDVSAKFRVPLEALPASEGPNLYKGTIPFSGFDTIIHWRLVVADQLLNQNCFPYIWNRYASYKSIRSVVDTQNVSTGATTQQTILFKTDQKKNRYELRYTGQELQDAGLQAGRIEKLGFRVATSAIGQVLGLNVSYRFVPQGAEIRNADAFTETSLFRNIFSDDIPIPAVGWFTITPPAPLHWDGESDLVIQWCWDNQTARAASATARVLSYADNVNRTMQFYSSEDVGEGCSSSPNAADGQIGFKPVLRLVFGPKDTLKKDAGVLENFIAPLGGQTVALTPTTIKVNVKNYGSDTLKNCKIYYTIDGNNTVHEYTWNHLNDADRRPIYPYQTKAVTITTTQTFTEGFHRLKMWTGAYLNIIGENNLTVRDSLLATDWEHTNDTAEFEIKACGNAQGMQGTYAIGNVSGVSENRTFKSFYETFEMLKACGVQGPVTIKVAQGVYKEDFIAPTDINGASVTNLITFEGVENGTELPRLSKSFTTAYSSDIPLFKMGGSKYLQFRKLLFDGDSAFYPMATETSMLLLDGQSSDLIFDSCVFRCSAAAGNTANEIHSLLNIHGAKNIEVKNSNFSGDATYQIYMKGVTSSNKGVGNFIHHNVFSNFKNGAVYAEFQDRLRITNNTFQNGERAQTSVIHAISIQNVNNVNIAKNGMVLYNIGGIMLSGITGNDIRSVVANNYISLSNTNTGVSSVGIYGVNFNDGSNTDVGYNNIYAVDMGNPNFQAVALCFGYPNKTLTNVTAYNNIVVSDGVGQAVYLRTPPSTTLSIDNNVYHKLSTNTGETQATVLFKKQTATYSVLDAWKQATHFDSSSYISDPMFLSWDNLYTSNTFLCRKGVPYSNISDDYNGASRPAAQPCIGAREFAPPLANINMLNGLTELDVQGMDNGVYVFEGCNLEDVYLKVKFANIGEGTIPVGSIELWYSVDGGTVSNTQKDTLNYPIPPDSTIIHQFRNPYNFSATAVGTDNMFTVRMWVNSTIDEVKLNDTTSCKIFSKYSLPASPTQTINVGYGDSATLTVTSRDSVYWYSDTGYQNFIKKGSTYRTVRLYADTTFYYARKQEIPELRITEIQVVRGQNGATPNPPSYITGQNAYEISNLGNGSLHLGNYKLKVYVARSSTDATLPDSPTSTYTFPDIVLPPHQAFILQEGNGESADSATYLNITLTAPKPTMAYRSGFVLESPEGTVVDAVAVNGAPFAAAAGVPGSIWNGGMLALVEGRNRHSGVSRSGTNFGSSAWRVATAESPMTLGTLDSNLIILSDNGCIGALSEYKVNVGEPPQFDPGMVTIALNNIDENPVCNLNDENIKVVLTNTGAQALTQPIPLVCHVYDQANGALVSTVRDTITSPLLSGDTIMFVFTPTIDLSANTETKDFLIEAIVNYAGDSIHSNDTVSMPVTSLETPVVPVVSDISIPYGERVTLTAFSQDSIMWYDSPTTERILKKGTNYQTPYLFGTDTFYVASGLITFDTVEFGTGVSSNTANALGYPSPFNAAVRNVKEQYLIKAEELAAQRYHKGTIDSLAFHIKRVSRDFALSDYTVKIGHTDVSELNSWQTDLTMVYQNTIDLKTVHNEGWFNIPFMESFTYEEGRNLVVEIAFSSAASRPVEMYQTGTPTNSAISYTSSQNQVHNYFGDATAYRVRPDMRFYANAFGCVSDRVPLVVNVGTTPSCDMGLLAVTAPSEVGTVSDIVSDVKVLMKNFGSDIQTTTNINWELNGVPQPPFTWTGNLASQDTTTVSIGSVAFDAGVNHIKAWVSKDCDTIATNDTVTLDFSACLGNPEGVTTLVIGTSTEADFPSFAAAVQQISQSGVCGSLVFEVEPGTYDEQLHLGFIEGVEENSNITFKAQNGDRTSVVLSFQPVNAETNYVLAVEGTHFVTFENITIKNISTTNNRNVWIKGNANNITFANCAFITTTGGTTNLSSNVYIEGENHNITLSDNYVTGGYQGITVDRDSEGATAETIDIINNIVAGFKHIGVEIIGAKEVVMDRNYIRGIAVAAEEVIGVNLTDVVAPAVFRNNQIYLTEGQRGNKRGFSFNQVNGTEISPIWLYNNSISLCNTSTSISFNYVGVEMEGSSHLNVYYNTVLVKTNNRSVASRAMSVGTGCSNLKIQNNNLDCQGAGHAYYVAAPGTQVVLSNYNNYITSGSNFCFWQRNRTSLSALQEASSQDAQSDSIVNVFISDSVLSPIRPSLADKALSIEDVLEDIRGVARSHSPAPSIGCYEYVFDTVDAGVISVLNPISTVTYIEGDPVVVQATIQNFGMFSLDSIPLIAELRTRRNGPPVSTLRFTYVGIVDMLQKRQISFPTSLFPALPELSLRDSVYLSVYTDVNGDAEHINDTTKVNMFILPAYDLRAVNLIVPTTRCELYDEQIRFTIKNVGEKTITQNDTIELTFDVLEDPSKTMVARVTLPYTDQTTGSIINTLPKDGQMTYTFQRRQSYYPPASVAHGGAYEWHTRGWVKVFRGRSLDNVTDNDTTRETIINAQKSPTRPVAHNDTIYYRSYGHPWAEQAELLPIQWYRDSTDINPFHASGNYQVSKNYTTPQLSSDTVFYLQTKTPGAYQCKTYFVPVRVIVRNKVAQDAEMLGIVEPPYPIGYVYMTAEDSVKILFRNNGTSPITNISAGYRLKERGAPENTAVQVIEQIQTNIAPGDSMTYLFNERADFSNPAKTYELRAWVSLNGDPTPDNDSTELIRMTPKNGNIAYAVNTIQRTDSPDISRVILGQINHYSNPFGNGYTDYTGIVSPAVLYKGSYDSIYITTDFPSSDEEVEPEITRGYICVGIDWQRNGSFNVVFWDSVNIGSTLQRAIHVPSDAISGMRRMRLILTTTPPDFTAGAVNINNMTVIAGEVEDYLITVMQPKRVDAEIMRFASPDHYLYSPTQDVSVVVRNTGATPFTTATIRWQLNGGQEEEYNFNHTLQPGDRHVAVLRNMQLPVGSNNLEAWVMLPGDETPDNDTARLEYHLFHSVKLSYSDNFDVNTDYFYAVNVDPTKESAWEVGTPAATNVTIRSAYSGQNCWKTNLDGNFPAQDESILYTPVFDISRIKSDTLSFMLYSDPRSMSTMFIEYLTYDNKWKRLGRAEDTLALNWYDDEEGNCFAAARVWRKCAISTQECGAAFNMGQIVQLRFIFRSKAGNNRGDGFAIDDFRFNRAMIPYDVGVIAVESSPEIFPNFGSYYYPKIVVKNYGNGTVTNFTAKYLAEDMFIPHLEAVSVPGEGLSPGDTMHYTFRQGHYLTVDVPSPFKLCAFTYIGQDLYVDNDSMCTDITIGPLRKDVGIVSINSPTATTAANSLQEVSIRIRSFGSDPVESLTVGYSVPNLADVEEVIYFDPPLYRGDEYVYTFERGFTSGLGTINLCSWVGLENDYFSDNDTLYKRVECRNNAQDLAARYVIIDETSSDNLRLQLVFSNRSAVAVEGISVGYFVNGNPATAEREEYGTLSAGEDAYHNFQVPLSRADGPFTGITAFVSTDNEQDRSNDTTGVVYVGYRDISADMIEIEETPDSMSRVRIVSHNRGTLNIASPNSPQQVRAYLVVDDDWENPYQEDITISSSTHDASIPLMFTTKIPRSASSTYNLVGWVKYEGDIDKSNDTTRRYMIRQNFEDLVATENIASEKVDFMLKQNKPNPYSKETHIEFILPRRGETRIQIVNTLGQIVFSEGGVYSAGSHTLRILRNGLPEGIYYYTLEFEGKQLSRKMIIVNP